VAGFIGSPAMNLIKGRVVANGIQIGDWVVPVAREVLAKAGDTATIGIRPEHLTVSDTEAGIPIDVSVIEELGADGYVYGTLSGLSEDARINAPQIVARTHARSGTHRGSKVRLMPDLPRMHVFNDSTQERIS